MRSPAYLYHGEYLPYRELLLTCKHRIRTFQKGEVIWRLGEPIRHVYFIERGVTRTKINNEDGRDKIVYFHGPGSLYPGCHQTQFKLELAHETEAVVPVEALEYDRAALYDFMHEHPELLDVTLETYARYINLLLFESAHQGFNEGLVRMSNVLQLLASDPQEGVPMGRIALTQDDLAQLLCMNRVTVTRIMKKLRDEGTITSRRGRIEVLNMQALAAHCSSEALA